LIYILIALCSLCVLGAITLTVILLKRREALSFRHLTNLVLSPFVNSLVRFGYEVFLEVCICTFLAFVVATDLTNAILVFIVLVMSIVGVSLLFWKGGPKHPDKTF
jgi:hypothetical protein